MVWPMAVPTNSVRLQAALPLPQHAAAGAEVASDAPIFFMTSSMTLLISSSFIYVPSEH